MMLSRILQIILKYDLHCCLEAKAGFAEANWKHALKIHLVPTHNHLSECQLEDCATLLIWKEQRIFN